MIKNKFGLSSSKEEYVYSRRARVVLVTVLTVGFLVVGLVMMLNAATIVASADAGDLFVMPDGTGDCSQANPCDLHTVLAAAGDDAAVYLAEGMYFGTGDAVVTLDHSVYLFGGWDAAPSGPVMRYPDTLPTVLDGQGERRVIHISPQTSPTIDGLVVKGGNATDSEVDPGNGGGIY